jgi:hypothetical protein
VFPFWLWKAFLPIQGELNGAISADKVGWFEAEWEDVEIWHLGASAFGSMAAGFRFSVENIANFCAGSSLIETFRRNDSYHRVFGPVRAVSDPFSFLPGNNKDITLSFGVESCPVDSNSITLNCLVQNV